jgi:hypothetical protein
LNLLERAKNWAMRPGTMDKLEFEGGILCRVASTPTSTDGASFGASSPAPDAGRPYLGSRRGDRGKKKRYRLLSSADPV